MNDIYSVLELNKIKDQILKYSKSEIGNRLINNISIISDRHKLDKSLTLLDEAIRYISKFGTYLNFISVDLFYCLDLASKGSSLNKLDFLNIKKDIAISNLIKKEFKEHKYLELAILNEEINSLYDLNNVLDLINKVIDENGNIKKNASEELNKLYKRKDYLDKKLLTTSKKELDKYKDFILENTSYSYKDNHLLLNVKTSYKSKVKGLIYDVSSSRQTTFIEPFALSEISNEINIINKEIEDEIKRILLELTSKIITYKNEILFNNNKIGQLDYLFSKARYSIDKHCNVIKFTKADKIDLKDAYHPLLEVDKVVKNCFYLDKEKRIMVISGPNAGGKTVALKTLAINILLLKCSLAIFASEESVIDEINYIYLDIGDNQSIENNLSTFSAHIKNISKIINKAKENDLVIIDEIGTGTSPKEGEALSVGIIKKLIKNKPYSLVSSHFELLKAFALSSVNSLNASMEFNEAKLIPTYHLRLDIPGKSYGIELAKRFNLDNEIINNAKKILNKNENNYLEEAIKSLNKKEQELKELKESLEQGKEELLLKIKNNEELEEKYKEKLSDLNELINDEKEELISDVKAKLDDILKRMYQKDNKPHDIIKLKEELDELNKDYIEEEIIHNDEELNIDDNVLIIDSSIEGIIKTTNKNKLVITTTDGLTIKVNKDNVKKIAKKEKNKKIIVPNIVNDDKVPLELNLVGERVDAALIKLEEYLDNARLHNIKEVSVVHGYGSGALRNAIHTYLSKQKYVKDYHLDDINFNHGVTIIHL